MGLPQVDSLVQRLVANSHDEEALSLAHRAGVTDPEAYALLLERVGTETRNPSDASHWLSAAASVWSTTLGDAHRAARVLMQAIVRDPTARTVADRLAQLYRDKGDVKALVALLEHRVKALTPLSARSIEIRQELDAMHDELGRLRGQCLKQPAKAGEPVRRKPSSRWDDLANRLEQEARAAPDAAERIAFEKRLARLHEQKRRDPVAAAEAWERVGGLAPDDARAVIAASKMYEQAKRFDRAAWVIAEGISRIRDPLLRGALLERLGRLRELLEAPSEAGEAYRAAAELQNSDHLWRAAERCLVAAGRWDQAGQAAVARARLASLAANQARYFARGAEHFAHAHDEAAARDALERATDLDPTDDERARLLCEHYAAASRWPELAHLLALRGDRLTDKSSRVAVRRQTAKLLSDELGDRDSARAAWWKVLEEGEDREALEQLIDDAVARADYGEAKHLLGRLGKRTSDRGERTVLALREAALMAEGIGDVQGAVVRCESILAGVDPGCRAALQALADLHEAHENPAAAVRALERELQLASDDSERARIGLRLERLYDGLDDVKNTIRVLELVRQADPDDLDALARLCDLCEAAEQWSKTADLLVQRIEVEANESDRMALTRRLSDIMNEKLDRGDAALRALAARLEDIAMKTRSLDALTVAHEVLVNDLEGLDRAHELVRQAESRLAAGAPRLTAVRHGEAGLSAVPPEHVEGLLERLSAVAHEPTNVVDLYERQIARCRSAVDRVRALARAARVAVAQGQAERARGFFDGAFVEGPADEELPVDL